MFTNALKFQREFRQGVFASDNTDHSKVSTITYLYKLLHLLPPEIKRLHIWSDGPTSQFKNRYIAAAMVLLEDLFPLKIVWNFFATSHGKGCVDGLGAVVKHRVRRMILAKKAIVNNATDFVSAFNAEATSIQVTEVSDSEITNVNYELELEFVFANAVNVPNITSFHQLQVKNGKVIGFVTSEEGYDSLQKN